MRLFQCFIWWKIQMKALQRNVASVFAALFFLGCAAYVAHLCDPMYFTTWALYLHCFVFACFATLRAVETCASVDDQTSLMVTRDAYLWLFSPAFSAAVCVLTTSVYLLIGAWKEAYTEYCLPDETQLDKENACLDFALEFTITHSGPPVLLALFAFIDRGNVYQKEKKVTTDLVTSRVVSRSIAEVVAFFTGECKVTNPKKTPNFSFVQRDVVLYGGHVFLTTALFPMAYGMVWEVKEVYGSVSDAAATTVFAATNVLASLSCAFYFTST